MSVSPMGSFGWRCAGRRHQVIEGADLVEQAGDLGFAASCRRRCLLPRSAERLFSRLQSVGRAADDHHLGAIVECGLRDAETDAGTAADDDNFSPLERCH